MPSTYLVNKYAVSPGTGHVARTEFLGGNGSVLGVIPLSKKKVSQNEELILPPSYDEDQKRKKVFTEGRADFALKFMVKTKKKRKKSSWNIELIFPPILS